MKRYIYYKRTNHLCKTGDTILVIQPHSGEYWFKVNDILKVINMKWNRSMNRRFSPFECIGVPLAGAREVRFVNAIGLLSLLHPNPEYIRARKVILDLIINYCKEPVMVKSLFYDPSLFNNQPSNNE